MTTSHTQRAAKDLVDILGKKNSDYAPSGEFSNFELAGQLAGLTAWDAILIQIGIKYTRLTSLVVEGVNSSNFEGVRDTLQDLAGYSLIGVGYQDSLQEPLNFEDVR